MSISYGMGYRIHVGLHSSIFHVAILWFLGPVETTPKSIATTFQSCYGEGSPTHVVTSSPTSKLWAFGIDLGELAKAIYLRAAFYRPPGNPVLVGSDTFGRYQSGIPTHRYGGPAACLCSPNLQVGRYLQRNERLLSIPCSGCYLCQDR